MSEQSSQSLSNFIYYCKDGREMNIDVRMGSLLNEHCDAIAFTVNESLNLNKPLPKKVLSQTGIASFIKKEVEIAKKARKYLSGDVATIALRNSDNEYGWKSIILVVMPYEPTLKTAYKSILAACEDNGYSSVAVVGLGCGQLGISSRISANSFLEAVIDHDNEKGLQSLKVFAVMDVQRNVVQSFISKLSEFVEDHYHLPENKSKLVFVSNENLLEYEARRLTTVVSKEQVEETDCVICLCPLQDDDEVCALKCSHQFHYGCFKNYLKQCVTRKCCPVCRKYFAIPCGNQPHNATMNICYLPGQVIAGYDVSIKTILISYHIPSGIQDETHLRPGLPFKGTTRYAYLPDTLDGRKILRLFKKAFDCRLIFTVGDSVTTGVKNVVTWNSIHHKTSPYGGPLHFGYPDETYFVRVRAELEEAGITEDLLSEEEQQELVIPPGTY